jgi:hypothetical protein
MSRRIRGTNDCDSKWVIYGICCTTCNLWYIGKTLTYFKVRWSNHKSNLKKNIEAYKDKGQLALDDLKKDGKIQEYHLVKHFCMKHASITSLKWTIIENVGKKD